MVKLHYYMLESHDSAHAVAMPAVESEAWAGVMPAFVSLSRKSIVVLFYARLNFLTPVVN